MRSIYQIISCTILEWFDFIIVIYLSVPMGHYFFPDSMGQNTKNIVMLLFATLPYFFRPIGGTILGFIADHYGRRKTFLTTISLMVFSTFFIILTPNYDKIGIYGAIIFLFLRSIQAFSLGGEYIVSAVILFELSNKNKYLRASMINFSTVFGTLLGQVAIYIIYSIWTIQELSYIYWKVPFALSCIFLLFVLILRMTMSNNTLKKTHSSKNFIESLNRNKVKILLTFLYLSFGGVSYYYFVVMGKMTLLNAGFNNYISTIFITSGLISLLIFIPISGYLANLINPIKIQIFAITSIILYSILYKYIVYSHILILCLASQIFFSILLSGYLGLLPAFICSLFNHEDRCLSLGFAYNLSLSIFGASTPVLISLLNLSFKYGDVIYLMISGIISLMTLFLVAKKHYENSY